MLSAVGLRSTSSDDPRYNNENEIVPYSNWRGPMWVNANALTAYGLARYGFKALAMVYQRSHSGEALGTLREANRIQRYNLWQMARVAWKKAKALAMAGRVDEADDEFLTAKHHYLLTLSRLERSKKKTVFGEYRRLQADITSWVTTRKLESVAATTDG